jgi:hypothetical protein
VVARPTTSAGVSSVRWGSRRHAASVRCRRDRSRGPRSRSRRGCARSLRIRAARWVLTMLMLMWSASAISLLVRPRATVSRTASHGPVGAGLQRAPAVGTRSGEQVPPSSEVHSRMPISPNPDAERLRRPAASGWVRRHNRPRTTTRLTATGIGSHARSERRTASMAVPATATPRSAQSPHPSGRLLSTRFVPEHPEAVGQHRPSPGTPRRSRLSRRHEKRPVPGARQIEPADR